MNITTTETLLDRPLALTLGQTMRFGQERDMFCDLENVLVLSDDHKQKIERDALEGLSAFGALEKTRAMSVVGLPTLLARVDCTIDPLTGGIHPYEVEERPAGIGIVDRIVTKATGVNIGATILDHLEDKLGKIPVVKRHPNALENDDGMLLPVEQFTGTKIAIRNRDILMRAEPHDMSGHPQLEEATAHAIAPIMEKGKREYRIRTGHAHIVTQTDTLPTDRSFVLKTIQGSKAKGVKICLSREDVSTHGNRDSCSMTKSTELLRSMGALLLEPFVPAIPTQVSSSDKIAHMILRIFTLISPNQVTAIGGSFVVRPGVLVHGSKDAIAGAVLPQGAL